MSVNSRFPPRVIGWPHFCYYFLNPSVSPYDSLCNKFCLFHCIPSSLYKTYSMLLINGTHSSFGVLQTISENTIECECRISLGGLKLRPKENQGAMERDAGNNF